MGRLRRSVRSDRHRQIPQRLHTASRHRRKRPVCAQRPCALVWLYYSVSVARIASQACLIDRSSISPSVESTTTVTRNPRFFCDCDKSSKSDALTFAAIKHTVMNAGLHSAISRPRWRASPRRHAESASATSSVSPLPLRPDHPRSCARVTLIALISR
jgi:hypothetical protein